MNLTIPQIREELDALVAEQRELVLRLAQIATRIETLAEASRRRHFSRASAESRPVTPEVVADVWRIWETGAEGNERPSFQTIADQVGVNYGRVSEIIHGQR